MTDKLESGARTEWIKPTTRTDAEEAEIRFDREHKPFFHPRTGDKIACVSTEKAPRHSRGMKHLNRFPCVAYHRVANAKLANGCFVLNKDGEIAWKGNTPADKIPVYEKAGSYKTVWFSKGMRRK